MKSTKYYISNNDIDSVSIKNLPYHNSTACGYIETYCKYLLEVARDYNDSNECGLLIDSFDLTKYRCIKGTEGNVKIDVDLGLLASGNIDDYLSRFIFIHNHPNNSWFSYKDIYNFLRNKYLYMLIAIQNNGISHILIKASSVEQKVVDYIGINEKTPVKELLKYLRYFNILYFRRYKR